MSKKKGLSLEEKRDKMVELFYEKREFFQLKELEKVAPKEKGIVYQSVKEVLMSLVDDGIVDSDKIGTFMCYWAFPSKAMNTRKNSLADVEKQLATAEAKLNKVQAAVDESRKGKEDTEERRALIAELARLKAETEHLSAEEQKYEESDPNVYQQILDDAKTARLAVNRWTDNIFAQQQWCKAKFSIDEKAFCKQFEIPDEIDYL